MGESQLQRGGAIFLDRPHLRLGGRSAKLCLPVVPHFETGNLGYLFGIDRQHQQPEIHECRLSSGAAASRSEALGKETLAGGELNNRQFNDYIKSGPLTEFFESPATVWTPRVLKDGADSVGALGALNRVYLNIGTFSEEWLLHFNPLVGGKRITPIEIKVARENSAYFAATENQTPAMAAFFLKTTEPHHLKDAPDHSGDKYLANEATLRRGKVVFAENCARCHSSKHPEMAPGLDPNGCAEKDYMSCWNRYWDWTKTDQFKDSMRKIVLADDFLKDNFLSAEFRVPVSLLHTNACSPLATNALGGNIWDNFSSQSYKDLPSVGEITWYDPVTGAPNKYTLPAGGRGYTRVPSLVSVWASAPYLLNNSVGPFEVDPSVEGRMRPFEASIEQMLWPERRPKDSKLGDKLPGLIDRTTTRSYIKVSLGYLPNFLQPFYSLGQELLPWIFGEGGVQLGPIPAGTPVGLLSNLNPLSEDPDPGKSAAHDAQLAKLVFDLDNDLKKLGKYPSDEQAAEVFGKQVNQLLALSKCPDLVVNRGHYFGTDYVEPGETKERPALEARSRIWRRVAESLGLRRFDYFRNIYYADVPYCVDTTDLQVWLRFVPDQDAIHLGGSPNDTSGREEGLSRAVAGHAAIRIEAQRVGDARQPFIPFAAIRFEDEIALDQEALHFEPVAGRGFTPHGYLTELRRFVYPASVQSRPHTHPRTRTTPERRPHRSHRALPQPGSHHSS